MEIKAITNDAEHAEAVATVKLFLAEKRTSMTERDAAELRAMALVIEDYESRRWPQPPPDPIDFIKFMMEQKGLKVVDVAPCFGTSARAYEVLNRKRNLTLSMIRKLRVLLSCPADGLIGA